MTTAARGHTARMRALAVGSVLVAVLAGCADQAGRPGASPGPTSLSASPTPPVTDVRLVLDALRATKAKGTATYVEQAGMTLRAGEVTLRRDGKYDLRAGRASIVQTFETDPPDAFARILGENVRPADLTARFVVTERAAYVQMARWPAPRKGRWLAVTPKDVARVAGESGEVPVFPPALEMLAEAKLSPKDGSGRSRVPIYAEVLVPGGEALRALPTSAVRKMVAAGVDLSAIKTDVEVTVEIDQGLVHGVSYDVYDAYMEAARQLGADAFSEISVEISEIGAGLLVSNHGAPVSIKVPPRESLLTPDDLEG